MIAPSLGGAHCGMADCVIVVPTLNEEANIESCLESLLASAGPMCPIVVADGGSVDRTTSIVETIAGREDRVILVNNPGRTQARAVNMVARSVHGRCKWLIRADAHSSYPDRFAQNLIDSCQTVGANSVVVRMRAVGTTCLERAVAYAQNSRLGNGGSLHRGEMDKGMFVDHGHHALFDLNCFNALGGYDDQFSHNEDFELDHRINAAGGKVWLTETACVDYAPRSTLFALAKQYYNHGKGRSRSVFKHRIVPKLRQMLPLVLLASYLVGICSLPWTSFLFMLPLGHLVLCLAWGLQLSWKHRDMCALASGPAAGVMHLSWAVGFCSGTLNHGWRKHAPRSGLVLDQSERPQPPQIWPETRSPRQHASG